MRHSFLVLGACLLGLSCVGCDNTLEPASRVTNLRLLAVAADKPAAEPGETVTLSTLYANPRDESLRFGYALCDGSSSSAALDCLRALDLESLTVSDDVSDFVITMPEPPSATQRPTAIGVAVIVCPGEIVPGDTHGVPIACEVDGQPLDINDFEMGVKRIFYADDSPNQNPQIAQLTFDGEPWPEDEVKMVEACDKNKDDVEECKPRFRHKLAVEAEEGALESFLDNDGNRVAEQLVAQFYATGGSFEYDVRTIESASTRFVAQARDAGKTLTVQIVVRDSRGGVSWQTRTIEVLP